MKSIQFRMGFTDEDVNTEAPRLYSDIYLLNYLNQMGSMGMNAYNMAITFPLVMIFILSSRKVLENLMNCTKTLLMYYYQKGYLFALHTFQLQKKLIL